MASTGSHQVLPAPGPVVDGHLLDAAASGNRTAISTLCGLIGQHVRWMAKASGRESDPGIVDLVDALHKIGGGSSPDDAFGWVKATGRPTNAATSRRKEAAKLAADATSGMSSKTVTGHDDLTSALVVALHAIESGSTPSEAFKWNLPGQRGRRHESNAFRNWEIQKAVIDEMKAGRSWGEACHSVSSDGGGEFLVSEELVKKLCTGLTRDSDVELGDDMFPLTRATYRTRE